MKKGLEMANSFIPKEHIQILTDYIVKKLNLNYLKYIYIGNIDKDYLSDIDIGFDKNEIIKKYKCENEEDFWNKIEELLTEPENKVHSYKIMKGLIQVSICIPLLVPSFDKKGIVWSLAIDENGNETGQPLGFVQVDVMLGNLEWMKYAISSAPKDSKYKAVHRNLLIVEIFSELIFKGNTKFQIDWKNGVEQINFVIDEKGKRQKTRKKLIYKDINKLIHFLFTDKSLIWDDMNSFEKLYRLFLSDKFRFNKKNKVDKEVIIKKYKNDIIRMKLVMPENL